MGDAAASGHHVSKEQLSHIATDMQHGNGCKVADDLHQLNLLNLTSSSSAMREAVKTLPQKADNSNPKVYNTSDQIGDVSINLPGLELDMKRPADKQDKGWFGDAQDVKSILNLKQNDDGTMQVDCKDYNYDKSWAPGQKSWAKPDTKSYISDDFKIIGDD